MSTVTELVQSLRSQVSGLFTRILSLSANDILYSAMGEVVVYGCYVTEGTDAADMTIALEGEDAADTAHANPDVEASPARGYQFPNIASLKDGAFRSEDLTAEVATVPATGLGRYDIAYIYVGTAGAGFAVASGTPSADVKTDFDTNGLDDTPHPSATTFDPDLPVGAMAVARIYVEDDVTGIPQARIADLRIFSDVGYSGAASTYADAAAASAAAAALSETAAETAETNAETAETNAETAEANAEAAQVAAEAAQTAAAASAAAAAASVDTIDTIDVLNWLGV